MNDEYTREYDDMGLEDLQEDMPAESSAVPSRRKKKPRVRKKRRKKYYMLRFLVLIAVCVGVYFFLHSAAFTVEKIEVEENSRFSSEEVIEMAKLKTGVNLIELNAGKCEDRLEKNPYIKEAQVSRKAPDTVKVVLELRTPVAVVMEKEKFVMLDREGMIVEIRDRIPWYTLFTGVNANGAEPGKKVKVKEEKLYKEYLELLDLMMDADIYFRSMAIEENVIKMYVTEKMYCIGEKENVIAGMKDGNLKAVLYNLSEKGIDKGVLSIGDDQYYSFSKSAK